MGIFVDIFLVSVDIYSLSWKIIARLMRPPGSIPGVGWVGRNQTKQTKWNIDEIII